MTRSSSSPEVFASARYSRCSDVSWVPRARSAMPRMPLSGVRISCDMFARNSPLARLAASAASRARCSSSSASLRRTNCPSWLASAVSIRTSCSSGFCACRP